MSRFELLSEERVLASPSSKDGISPKEENDLRTSSCVFIRTLCKSLDLYPCSLLCSSRFLHSEQNHMSFIPPASSFNAFTVFSPTNRTIVLYASMGTLTVRLLRRDAASSLPKWRRAFANQRKSLVSFACSSRIATRTPLLEFPFLRATSVLGHQNEDSAS